MAQRSSVSVMLHKIPIQRIKPKTEDAKEVSGCFRQSISLQRRDGDTRHPLVIWHVFLEGNLDAKSVHIGMREKKRLSSPIRTLGSACWSLWRLSWRIQRTWFVAKVGSRKRFWTRSRPFTESPIQLNFNRGVSELEKRKWGWKSFASSSSSIECL